MAKIQNLSESELIFRTIPKHPRLKNLSGQKFNKLFVIGFCGLENRNAKWFCKCECGNLAKVSASCLKSGHTKSCGCLFFEAVKASNRKHGHSGYTKTKTYGIWSSMRERCTNTNNKTYKNYGSRGITVCERWQVYENFLADMGERPSKEHSLDRIDNDGNYCPENCRWATKKQQANNTRSNRFLTLDGITLTMAQWGDKTGIGGDLIYNRLKKG